jgi:hypothetical protein
MHSPAPNEAAPKPPDGDGVLPIERVAGTGRATGAVVVIVAVVLGVLVFKPWTSGVGSPQAPSPAPSVALTVAPSVANASLPPAIPGTSAAVDPDSCQGRTAWSIVAVAAVAAGADRQGRTLIPVIPVRSSDPTDPAIPTHVLYAPEVRALGFCLPSASPAVLTQEGAGIRLWRIGDKGQASVIHDLDVDDADLALAGELYYLPSQPVGTNLGWPPGHYLFQIPGTRLSGPSDWFGFEFQQVGG